MVTNITTRVNYMKNKTFKNKSLEELEAIIINCLAIAGIVLNIIGVFVATLFPNNHYNIFPTRSYSKK